MILIIHVVGDKKRREAKTPNEASLIEASLIPVLLMQPVSSSIKNIP